MDFFKCLVVTNLSINMYPNTHDFTFKAYLSEALNCAQFCEANAMYNDAFMKY